MRLIGPGIVLAGAIVTLPSMLGMSAPVELSIGRWWTVVIAVAGAVMLMLLSGSPIGRWRRRTVGVVAGILVLYGIVMTLWGNSVTVSHEVPAGDLPYLIGLPIITGVGALVTLVTMFRLRGAAA